MQLCRKTKHSCHCQPWKSPRQEHVKSLYQLCNRNIHATDGIMRGGRKRRSGTHHKQQHLWGDALEQHILQIQTKPDHAHFFFFYSKPIKTLFFLDFLALSRYQVLLRSSLPCCTLLPCLNIRENINHRILSKVRCFAFIWLGFLCSTDFLQPILKCNYFVSQSFQIHDLHI